MALSDKPAFSAGELDPALWERTNLDKYRTGLATARNWIISKTGSVLTRQSRRYAWNGKLVNRKYRNYAPPGGGVLLEWGHLYVRIYNLATLTLLADLPHTLLETDLPNIHFDTAGSFVYIFCSGKIVQKLNYAIRSFVDQSTLFAVPVAGSASSLVPLGTPTGYQVEYGFTYVINGEESAFVKNTGQVNLPIATGQSITVNASTGAIGAIQPFTTNNYSEFRFYRRPYNTTNSAGGGAWGYIGSSTSLVFNAGGGGSVTCTFTDVGGDADYTHQPPSSAIINFTSNNNDPLQLLSPTGIVYQQRLLITDGVTDLQAIYASQIGYLNDYNRNYPLDAASALKFKCGTSGYARVLRLLDSDGLVAFTSAGIFLNQGDLAPNNLSMVKKGKWIIDPTIPPLAIPGGVIFQDSFTNGVRVMNWSFQLNAFDADEVSIYSNHLFRSRQMSSWCFQQGFFPLLFTVFTDGGFAGFTFDYTQQMQAWTRHDGVLPSIDVCGTTVADQTFFVTAKIDPNNPSNTIYYTEYTVPRYPTPSDVATNPNYKLGSGCAYMDGMISVNGRIAPLGTTPFVFDSTFIDPENNNQKDWSVPLNVTCSDLGLFTGQAAVVGNIIRFFDEDLSAVDVKILSFTDANNIQVQIDNLDVFPSQWVTGAVLYNTFTQITGLTSLELEYPSVVADGGVMCSPNNDQENYPSIQVVNGVFNLPPGQRAAIIHLGRPIVGDVMTLDIDTVEQAPTLIESLTVNKLYIKVKDSKGLYVGPEFPQDNGVKNMVPIDDYPVDYTQDIPIIGNRAAPATTRRIEVMMNGSYSKQGKIAVRQVDPLHAEILSFIPDAEILKRSDR